MRAIGYVRVSTEEQARDGLSLDAQRARFFGWCEAQGIPPGDRELHGDEGLSGKRADNRPGLAAALDAVCAAGCAGGGVLVVYSLSRMARSVRDTLAIAERLEKSGADLVSLSESIDTTTATGKMIFRLLAVLAEFERDLIIERTRAGLSVKRARGQRIGAVPRGMLLDADGVTLRTDHAEQLDIEAIRILASEGHGPRSIARRMTFTSRRSWPESTIRRILKRPQP